MVETGGLENRFALTGNGGSNPSPSAISSSESILENLKQDTRPQQRLGFSSFVGVEDLTARELEVLKLVAHGHSNREIANTLGIAEKTARIHVSNILGKMGVSDRTQLAIAAIQRGLVDL